MCVCVCVCVWGVDGCSLRVGVSVWGGALSVCICVGVTVFSTCVSSELHGVHCTDEPQKGETVTVLTVCSSLDHIIYV